MARKYQLNDPGFNEYVFDCIINSTPEQRQRLPTKLLRYTWSKERIKSFADKASLERKIEMLSRLGYEAAIFFSPPSKLVRESIKETYKNYAQGTRRNDVDEMLKSGMYVVTSREIMAILGVMGMNCHSPTYSLNRDYTLLATAISNLSEINPTIKDIDKMKSVLEDNRIIVKLLLYNLTQQNFVDGSVSVKVKELQILMFLFISRNKFVSCDTIGEFFAGTYSPQIISATLFRLNVENLVLRFPKKADFAISTYGIQLLTQHIGRLINFTLNF